MAPPSAKVGEPPLTQDDYHIARGILLSIGLYDVDAHNGAKLPPARPHGHYEYQSRSPNMVVASIMSIVIMLVVTGLRLAIRLKHRRLQFGLDDWMIIPGVVSRRHDWNIST